MRKILDTTLKYPFPFAVGGADTMALSITIIDNFVYGSTKSSTAKIPIGNANKSGVTGNVILLIFLCLLSCITVASLVLLLKSYTKTKHYESKSGSEPVLSQSFSENIDNKHLEEYKICPRCAEKVKKNAKKCKHCGKSFGSVFTREIGFVPLFLIIIFIASFFGFFHIIPDAPGFPIVPKSHFSYSMTFITIDEFLDRWNNRSLGEAIRGDNILENLNNQFKRRGWVVHLSDRDDIE